MNFMGKKHAVNWLIFTKSILKRKNRYVSVEFVEMSVRNIWFGRIIKIEMF